MTIHDRNPGSRRRGLHRLPRQLFINGQWCDAASGKTFQAPNPGSPPGIGRANDVVVRRILDAGLDLQVALGLIGDHSGAGKIYHALDELDQAIKDIRDTIFDRSPPSSPRFSH